MTRRPTLRDRVATMFAIDLRALAAFRILIGLVLLYDLAERSRFVVDHYTDAGVVPRSMMSANAFRWSLHALSGEAALQYMLLAAAGLCAAALVAGIRTRVATVACWVLLVSLHTRNPYILNGGDTLLRCLLFWAMFLPLGGRWSLDRALGGDGRGERPAVSSIATAAILLQLALMYWFTALLKDDPAWTRDYTAIYLALGYENYALPLGSWLRSVPQLLAPLTAAVYWLEWLGPCLIFLPYGNRWGRTAAAAFFLGMHLSLLFCLTLGLFSYVCATAWLLVLPSIWWDRLEAGFHRVVARLGLDTWATEARRRVADRLRHCVERPRLRPYPMTAVLVAFLLGLTLMWNVADRHSQATLSKAALHNMRWIGHVTRLDQRWSMFAPKPPRYSCQYELIGRTADGRIADLWSGTLCSGSAGVGPMEVSSHRWRKYLSNLQRDSKAENRAQFAEWAARRWNRRWQQAGRGELAVVGAELRVYLKENTPPGQTAPAAGASQLFASVRVR